MRSNWSTAPGFYANMGNLVTTNWQPNSQYWIYKRYADQTGLRIKTTAGSRVDAVGLGRRRDEHRRVLAVLAWLKEHAPGA